MLTVLSPAKKLDSENCVVEGSPHSTCSFLDSSDQLVHNLRKLGPETLGKLMNISDNLSILNWERYQNWTIPFKNHNSRQAMYSFKGDTYTGFNAKTLSAEEVLFCQENTRILSGLYGILKPMDLIMPYRLEMGTKLKNTIGNDLYSFWSSSLTKSLNEDLEKHQSKFIINCASVEYFKVINTDELNGTVVSPVFKEMKQGKAKIISFFAKKARGQMARYIVKNKIQDPSEILSFTEDGYSYDSNLSEDNCPVFIR